MADKPTRPSSTRRRPAARRRPSELAAVNGEAPTESAILGGERPAIQQNGEAPAGTPDETGAKSNLFDPAFALDDEDDSPAVNPPVNDVPVRKPDKLKFYRVHPKFVLDRYILVVRDGMDETNYLITPELRLHVPEAVTKARIYPYIGTTKTVALWRVNHPKEGSRRNRKVYDSAARATEAAKSEWTRIWWNMDTSSYSHQTARVDLGEPQWPDMDFQEMLEIAFDGLVIDTADHPVLRAIMTGQE